MLAPRTKKWTLIALIVLVVLAGGGVVGFRIAVGILKGKVLEALGPDSEIGQLDLGWSAVQVAGLRLKGRQGWPAADTLRAERVVIVPNLRSLLSARIQVGSVSVVKPYLSALRTKEGKLLVVPSLLAGPAAKDQAAVGPPARSVAISRLSLEDGVLELFDATVAQPPLKIRLEQIRATVQDLLVPSLTGKSRLEVSGVVKGVKRDGRVHVAGWLEAASKDSSLKVQMRSVDLLAFQPYLIKAADTRLQTGALDLDLQSEVSQSQLRAPGKVVLSDLEFAPTRGAWETFLGVPRAAVVGLLKSKDDKIEVHFVIEGDLNNPRFALNEAFATRIASALAEKLGVSLRGAAEGAASLGRQGVEAAGEAARGASDVLKGLFGGQKK